MKKIQPASFIEGEVSLPSDKSIYHRAVLLGSLADREVFAKGTYPCKDVLSSIACVNALGGNVKWTGEGVQIQPIKKWQDATLDCGNSATTMRLLAGAVCGRGVDVRLVGDQQLSSRPMDRVAKPLRALGANVSVEDGGIRVRPATVTGGEIYMQTPSAQVKSAILLAGLCGRDKTRVIEPIATRNHTELMLSQMGAKIEVEGSLITLSPSVLQGVDMEIPADISAASFFMTLGALRGNIVCKNVTLSDGRVGILRAFDRMGVRYTVKNQRICAGEKRGDITVCSSEIRPLHLVETEVPALVDEIPLIALLCAFAKGESRLCGLKELRYKESDRLLETEKLLRAFGGECCIDGEALIIRGSGLVGGNYHATDHRMLMCACIALSVSEKGGYVSGEQCCEISFPQFFEELIRVGGKVE